MNGLNLFGKDWANIVFEGRNKLYGAYKLRQESGKNTYFALAIGLGLLSVIFGSSYLYASKGAEVGRIIEIPPIATTPIIDEKLPTEEVIDKKDDTKKVDDVKNKDTKESSARTDVQKNKRYTDANVIKDDLVKDQVTSQDKFDDNTNSGQKDSDADTENGTLKKDGAKTGTSKDGAEGKKTENDKGTGESTTNAVMKVVQRKAEPNEGFDKFYQGFIKKFSANGSNNVSEITIKLKFVVEKDGSFSDIQVLDDKSGLGQEAIRVLKNMPKWKPAQHNGHTVRSMFTLPIKMKVNN